MQPGLRRDRGTSWGDKGEGAAQYQLDAADSVEVRIRTYVHTCGGGKPVAAGRVQDRVIWSR